MRLRYCEELEEYGNRFVFVEICPTPRVTQGYSPRRYLEETEYAPLPTPIFCLANVSILDGLW